MARNSRRVLGRDPRATRAHDLPDRAVPRLRAEENAGRRGWLLPTVLACGALAAVGGLSVSFDAKQGSVRPVEWLATAGAAWAGALCLLGVSTGHREPAWCRYVAALSLAALGPMVPASNPHGAWSSAALAASVLAVVMTGSTFGHLGTALAASLIAAACACDATALVWPIGCAWAAVIEPRSRRSASVLLAAGVAGVAIGSMAGWPVLAGWGGPAGVRAVHADLILCLPVVLVGAAGWTSMVGGRSRLQPRTPGTRVGSLSGWAGAGAIGLALGLLAVPVDIRLCVLPLWWWMSTGLRELETMIRQPLGETAAVRWVGLLVCGALAFLAWAAVRQWVHGALIGVYIATS